MRSVEAKNRASANSRRSFIESRAWRSCRKETWSKPQALLRRAIEIARTQNASMWELRATTSLARLLAKQGKLDEARAILADIYSWFTEGFDTADLKDARALLGELNA